MRCGFALVPSSNTTSDGRNPEPEPLLHPSPVFVLRVDVDLEGGGWRYCSDTRRVPVGIEDENYRAGLVLDVGRRAVVQRTVKLS